MPYQGKTDWNHKDTPTEHDFNRIEQGITDAMATAEDAQAAADVAADVADQALATAEGAMPRFAEGTYIGDGVDGRVILVGFTPIWVEIIPTGTNFNAKGITRIWSDGAIEIKNNTPYAGMSSAVNNFHSIVDGGFEIRGSSDRENNSNYLNYNYKWMAWGVADADTV